MMLLEKLIYLTFYMVTPYMGQDLFENDSDNMITKVLCIRMFDQIYFTREKNATSHSGFIFYYKILK